MKRLGKPSFSLYISIFISCFLLIAAVSLVSGSGLSMHDSADTILHMIAGNAPGEAGIPESAHRIILTRLPRICLAALAGAGLSVAGAILQSLLRNPLADPYFMGVSAGASLGSALVLVLPLAGLGALGQGVSMFAAFAGAVIAVTVTLLLAGKGGGLGGSSIILAGIAVSTFLTAIVSGIMTLAPNQFERIVFWNLGSFSSATWEKVAWTGGAFVAGLMPAIVFARDLDLMLLGEEHAHHLGLPVKSRKILFLGASALMASAAVASCGIIAFAGLIVPNIVRAATGSSNRKLIPVSAIVGASFLLLADTLSRTLFAPVQVPVSIFTALAGAPFFLYLLAKNSRKTSDKEKV